MLTRICLSTALLASVASAQITSPKGYVSTEGTSSHNYMLFSKYEMRWQGIDRSHVGAGAKVMNEVAWRRDGTSSTGSTWTARTMSNWEMNMGLADWATLQVTDLEKNYKTGSKVQVVKPRTLSVVDISAPPTSAPAPWTTVVKFDAPFVYTGSDPFVWEVIYSGNTVTTDYSFDFQYVGTSSGYSSTSGTAVGTNCTATGMTSAISTYVTFYNHLTKFRIYYSLYNMPANSPAFMWIDGMDQNLTVPGLCTKLHALPLINIPLGVSDATGRVGSGYIDNLPYVPSVIGNDLYFQYVGVDLGQAGLPFALSAGRKITVPADPVPTQVTRFYHYKTTATSSTTTSGPWYGGIITRFQ
ncbi:MAG: hypothetical protein H6832_05215 [Planctomycetes bacterium]|nr:hypothetical protein [Planctomycetota bacterium]